VVTLTGQQLNWLLDGIDLRYVQPHQTLHYKSALWLFVDSCEITVQSGCFATF
jgi:hypothetical protein